jgi:sialic acid synthase SpsE
MKGTDHAASVEPDGMARLVRNIREVEAMRGQPQPLVNLHDGLARRKLGRSLTTARRIAAGETIGIGDLRLKSPGDGIPWRDIDAVIGATMRRAVPEDVTIQPSDLLPAAVPVPQDGGL